MARTVPVMATEAPGNYLTGALWNANVKALGDFLTGPPMYWGYQATAQSISNNGFPAITLDTDIVDTEGGHSTTTNTSRYVCRVAGWYFVETSVCFTTNATGFRAAKALKNGVTVPTSEQTCGPVSGFQTTALAATNVSLAVGDYVEMGGFQNSGGALLTSSNAGFDYVSYMRLRWIST